MFEISQLKEMKLPELQEIAKKLNVSKYRSLKKLDLVYQILDQQAANSKAVKEFLWEEPKKEVPNQKKQRERIIRPAKTIKTPDNTQTKQTRKPAPDATQE